MSLSLIEKLADARTNTKEFVSPYIGGDVVFVKICGVLLKLKVKNSDKFGWFVYKNDGDKARKIRTASEIEVSKYSESLKKHMLLAVKKLTEHQWLCYPSNADVFAKTFGKVEPVVLNFAYSVEPFTEVKAFYAGAWFYESENFNVALLDVISNIKDALKSETSPDDLKIKGITPELTVVYNMLYSELEVADPLKRDRKKVESVMSKFNCRLGSMKENYGATYTIEWYDERGQRVITTIDAGTLKANTAGYCLDGEDRKFDLTAVVALKNKRYETLGY